MSEPMRTWNDPDGYGFRVELYETSRTSDWGKSVVEYKFYHQGELIFQDSICVPGTRSVDGDETLALVIGWCCLRPGDTDKNFFNGYSERQMDWCREFGETLSLYSEPEWLGVADEETGDYPGSVPLP